MLEQKFHKKYYIIIFNYILNIMISILEYIHNKFENKKVINIIFQLDEDSIELLDDNLQKLILEGNRTIWTSNDGDELLMGDHANNRRDRPIDKGGDGGKKITQNEIINMFRWAWDDIMEMNYDGKLKTIIYNNKPSSFTIECQCWLNIDKEHNNKIIYGGARPKDMNLWAAWMIEENGSKIDIIIKTIFRGQLFKHSKTQERIRIRANGDIEQRYKEN